MSMVDARARRLLAHARKEVKEATAPEIVLRMAGLG